MRITDILKGSLTAILNEDSNADQGKPSRKKLSLGDAQAEYKAKKDADKKAEDDRIGGIQVKHKKRSAANKAHDESGATKQFNKADPGANSASKGKYQKPATDSKRAGSVEQKDQEAHGKVDQKVKDGKGTDRQGSALKGQETKKAKSGERDAINQADQDKQKSKGTLAQTGNYGDGDNAAAKAQQKQLDTIGTEDYEEHDFGKDSRPKFSNDNRDVAHGLDAAQQGDGSATAGSAGTLSRRQEPGAGGEGMPPGQEEWDEKEAAEPGDQLPPHNPADVDAYLASNDVIQRGVGEKMKEANDEWFERQAAASSSKGRRAQVGSDGRYDKGEFKGVTPAGRDAQLAHRAQKKAEKDALPDMSPEAAEKARRHQEVLDRNAEIEYTGADNARLGASGAQRGELEVSQRKAQANRDDMEAKKAGTLDKDEDAKGKGKRLTGMAQAAAGGDQKATSQLFKHVSPMLMQVANKYSFGDADKKADLYGEAKVAFMTAIKTFDAERGAEFTTHLMNTMKGMVRDASYQNRGDIQVSKDTQKQLGKYQELQKKWADQGLTGYQADQQIIVDMGWAKDPENIPDQAWDKLDKLKQAGVTRGNVSMHGAAGSDDQGNEIDADTSAGVQSEFTGDDAIGGGSSTDDQIDHIEKELATGSDEAVKGKFDELISMAGLDDDEAGVIEMAFGIGHDGGPMTDSELAQYGGMSSTKLTATIEEALYKMAAYIAQENGTDTDEEMMNLKKIYKYRGKTDTYAKLGRNTGDYVDGGEDEATQKERRTAKSKQAHGSKESQKAREWEKKERAKRQKEKDKNQGKA